ncbi:MAG: amidase [Pseudomonadales bacterium]|nr:amidase [Pseudomonadales bacterium]
MSVNHPSGIFCEHGPRLLQWSEQGLLADKRLAVKDLFALKGYRNAAGNPDWYASHSEATQTAVSLARCLNAGAIFNGFTITDELAYALQGANMHYGCADNPKAPGHVCGGSSMGSAAAVAANLADIALGTDTGGSVRVPASYCGIYGIRPSHNAVSTEGLVALAPPFDTVGWFANNADDLALMGEVLLPKQNSIAARSVIICEDILALAEPDIADAIRAAAPAVAEQLSLPLQHRRLAAAEVQLLNELNTVFSVLQGRACAEQHGVWIERNKPSFEAAIAERFAKAMTLSEAEVLTASQKQLSWQQIFKRLIAEDDILILPSSVSTAPKPDQSQSELRQRLLSLTAIAGLTGSVQIHVPSFTITEQGMDKPSGYSLLRHSGHDQALLASIREII